MLKSKKVNLVSIAGLIATDVIIILLTERSFVYLNQGKFNKYEESLLEPLFFGSLPIIIILFMFLTVNDNLFKTWLKYIASWYIPLSIFFISQIDIYSSFILAIDRTTAALYWMGGLFILTSLFIGYQMFITKK